MAEQAKDELVALVQEEYLNKLFYFCLKKTGNTSEAEDLASDITVQILIELEKGTVPVHFSGWFWQIVHNKYAAWAKKKRQSSLMITSSVADQDLMVEDRMPSVADLVEQKENLRLLRRELAFISADYRQIIAAYYLQGMSVQSIASAMQLPSGTVMTRLHRARKKLKEGMDMAREFGKRSFNPEQIGFSSSGKQPSGLPWSAVRRLIPINILCAANNNPSTVEELAVEMGIALPYMEEEVALLEKAELLTKLDNGKYLTNFFIRPRECGNEIYELACRFVENNGAALWNLGGLALQQERKDGMDTSAYSENDAQMFYAFMVIDWLRDNALPADAWHQYHFARRDGGNWGFMGIEQGSQCRLPMVSFSNNTGTYQGNLRWEGYQADTQHDGTYNNPYFTGAVYQEDVPKPYFLPVLAAIAEGQTKRIEKERPEDLALLLKKGFCIRQEDGTICVHALLSDEHTSKCESGIMPVQLCETQDYKTLQLRTDEYISQVRSIIAKYCHPHLQKDFDYYVAMNIEIRPIFAVWCKTAGRYLGNHAQFCAFYY